jgi:manganese/iron transport system substrate-binding protein
MLSKLGILVLLIGLGACSTSPQGEISQEMEQEELPLVVATTNVLCDLTEQVAQETVNLKCLVGAGVDPHVYQATPDDRLAIENADLILYGGYNFDSSLIRLVEATSNDAPKIAVHEKAVPKPIMGADHHHDHDHDHHHHHDHDHGSKELVPDPHVWHDPKNGIAMIAVITEGLAQIQPDLAAEYESRAMEIKTNLTQLDQWITAQIATIPKKQRKLVTTHDALGYYVKAYNLEFQGALSGISTEEAASAASIASLVKEIQKTQVPTIFAESSINPKLIETVAREAQVQVFPSELYADSLGEKGTGADTYQGMLIANTKAIVEGLGGQFTLFSE